MACHAEGKLVWEWAIARNCHISAVNCHISAVHLPGSNNILADTASRVFDVNTEWSLDEYIFTKLSNMMGPFSFDLFASRLNHKVPFYSAWKPDPGARFIDAFSILSSTI